MTRVGVIGQGAMGRPMALNLLKAEVEVTVFNRTRSKCLAAADAGAVVADSIPALVATSEVIVIMVKWDQSVCEVILGPDGVLAAGHRGLLVIDSTTIHPFTSQDMAAALAAKEIDYLDAPVMSDSAAASRGELYFLVGGDEQAYVRAIPVFEAMGNRHVHLGSNGTGSGAKIGSFTRPWWKKRGYVDDVGKSYG